MGQTEFVRDWLAKTPSESRLLGPEPLLRNFAQRRQQLADAVAAGELTATIQAETAAEIRVASEFARAPGLQAVLLGPRDLRRTAETIGERFRGVVAPSGGDGESPWLSRDFAKCGSAGAALAILGDDPHRIRATAAGWVLDGLDREQALQALTSSPVTMFQADELAGIRAGSPADVVIWTGSPLDLQSRPVMTLVGGQVWEDTP